MDKQNSSSIHDKFNSIHSGIKESGQGEILNTEDSTYSRRELISKMGLLNLKGRKNQ